MGPAKARREAARKTVTSAGIGIDLDALSPRGNWLGREDSNLRMGESKSARTLSTVNAHSEYGAISAAICINRLARISEWAPANPASGEMADL
jgi:hypothetical protein